MERWISMVTVALVVLKLCGVISWPWWLILSPLWIPLLLLVGLYLAIIIISRRKLC
jgi:hypothetical protein